jgi:short-subunit dehydrogenase
VIINTLHPIYLIKALLDKILARPIKSAIVVTSSSLAKAPIPGFLAYSCTKTFSSFLAEGLNYELEDKVDVLSFQCGQVRTKLLKGYDKSLFVSTPQYATRACLKDLGSKSMTYGPALNEIQMAGPVWLMQKVIYRKSHQVFYKYRQEECINTGL